MVLHHQNQSFYHHHYPDSQADTQPARLEIQRSQEYYQKSFGYQGPTTRRLGCGRFGCCLFTASLLGAFILLLAYFLAPLRTNILLLGIDARPGEANFGRTDTIILTTIIPLKPYVGMLSIPRDLWVSVPGHGENRINTAYFYGEVDQPGSGPDRAVEAVQKNFGVDVHYHLVMRFDNFEKVVDAFGGVDVDLPEPMSGYPAGKHHMNGEQALALVRDRQGSDDFFRMERAQIFLKSSLRQALVPTNWPHLPQWLSAISESMDTDIPVWLWPRLGLAILRSGADGIDARIIVRDMVNPFTTDQGAAVLAPNWQLINPVLMEMFGQ